MKRRLHKILPITVLFALATVAYEVQLFPTTMVEPVVESIRFNEAANEVALKRIAKSAMAKPETEFVRFDEAALKNLAEDGAITILLPNLKISILL